MFLVLVVWFFGSPFRGNNYALLSVLMQIVLFGNSIQVVFLVLQNDLFRYFVARTASLFFQLVFSAPFGVLKCSRPYSAITWCSGS